MTNPPVGKWKTYVVLQVSMAIYNSESMSMVLFVSAHSKDPSALQLTTNLTDICYDCCSGLRANPASEELDIEQATDQLSELRDVLETLFKVTISSLHLPGLGLLLDQVNELLSKCRSELSKLETALKREKDGKRMEGSSSTLDWVVTLTTLAMKVSALRGIVYKNQG